MIIYNLKTEKWIAIPGRAYTIHPAPEITGDDLIVAHQDPGTKDCWVALHAGTSAAIARGTTRAAATWRAAHTLRHTGREQYLAAVKRRVDAGALAAVLTQEQKP